MKAITAKFKGRLSIDVMVQNGNQYYCTLFYFFNPLFKIDMSDVERFVHEKRPTLKYRNDVVLVLEEK